MSPYSLAKLLFGLSQIIHGLIVKSPSLATTAPESVTSLIANGFLGLSDHQQVLFRLMQFQITQAIGWCITFSQLDLSDGVATANHCFQVLAAQEEPVALFLELLSTRH